MRRIRAAIDLFVADEPVDVRLDDRYPSVPDVERRPRGKGDDGKPDRAIRGPLGQQPVGTTRCKATEAIIETSATLTSFAIASSP